MPAVRGGGVDNNRRLLRKPQRRKPEPLRECISPPDTPPDELEADDELREVNLFLVSLSSELAVLLF